MGKQGRKKQRQKRKQQNDRPHSNEAFEDSRQAVNPSAAIHQLRHPDPKIRQNALVAMQATVLHNTSKRISVAVLQAVREQVMDANLECASAAAECLVQYLSHIPNIENQGMTTAGWTPVLLVRLNQCLKAIENKADSKPKLWYALAAPCAKGVCKLVENNELALEGIMNSNADSFLSTILGLLRLISSFEVTTDSRWNSYVEDAALYAARSLHSSLDENPDLAERINATQDVSTDSANAAWSVLLSKLPSLAKLHVCGSLVTMHQVLPASWQTSVLVQDVVPCLFNGLLVQPDLLASTEQDYAAAVELRKKQHEDERLEGEIVRKIQDRKEPARIIARRQKDVDRGSKAVILEEDTKDGEQAMEDSLASWSGIILPLHVTLEVTANLLSTLVQDDDGMDHDGGSNHEEKFHQALLSCRLAESLIETLQSLCAYLLSRGSVPTEHDSLTDDLSESVSKCSACIVNAILSDSLEDGNYEATWKLLRPYANFKGVSSVLVVLTQRGLPFPADDAGVIRQLLHSSLEESQRDGVCLLAIMLNNSSESTLSPQAVNEAAQELAILLKQGENLGKIEALNAIMDLWGQDGFYPQVFESQQMLPSFQAALASLSTDKTLDAEAEEVLFNASRFVDYKLGR